MNIKRFFKKTVQIVKKANKKVGLGFIASLATRPYFKRRIKKQYHRAMDKQIRKLIKRVKEEKQENIADWIEARKQAVEDLIAEFNAGAGRCYWIMLKRPSGEDINEIKQSYAIVFERQGANWQLHCCIKGEYKVQPIKVDEQITVIEEILSTRDTSNSECIEVENCSDISALAEIATSLGCSPPEKESEELALVRLGVEQQLIWCLLATFDCINGEDATLVEIFKGEPSTAEAPGSPIVDYLLSDACQLIPHCLERLAEHGSYRALTCVLTYFEKHEEYLSDETKNTYDNLKAEVSEKIGDPSIDEPITRYLIRGLRYINCSRQAWTATQPCFVMSFGTPIRADIEQVEKGARVIFEQCVQQWRVHYPAALPEFPMHIMTAKGAANPIGKSRGIYLYRAVTAKNKSEKIFALVVYGDGNHEVIGTEKPALVIDWPNATVGNAYTTCEQAVRAEFDPLIIPHCKQYFQCRTRMIENDAHAEILEQIAQADGPRGYIKRGELQDQPHLPTSPRLTALSTFEIIKVRLGDDEFKKTFWSALEKTCSKKDFINYLLDENFLDQNDWNHDEIRKQLAVNEIQAVRQRIKTTYMTDLPSALPLFKQYFSYEFVTQGVHGLEGFGCGKDVAFKFIHKRSGDADIKALLLPRVKDQLTNEAFVRYLKGWPDIKDEVEFDEILQNLDEYGQRPAVIKRYLAYLFQMDKAILSPVIWQLLACALGVGLKFWDVGDDTQLVPSPLSSIVADSDQELVVNLLLKSNQEWRSYSIMTRDPTEEEDYAVILNRLVIFRKLIVEASQLWYIYYPDDNAGDGEGFSSIDDPAHIEKLEQISAQENPSGLDSIKINEADNIQQLKEISTLFCNSAQVTCNQQCEVIDFVRFKEGDKQTYKPYDLLYVQKHMLVHAQSVRPFVEAFEDFSLIGLQARSCVAFGEALAVGERLLDVTGHFKFVLGADGRGTVYERLADGTTGILYRTPDKFAARSSSGKEIGTKDINYFFKLRENDGAAVIYADTIAPENSVWCDTTFAAYGDGAQCHMQSDGHLVAYHEGKAQFRSRHHYYSAHRLAMRGIANSSQLNVAVHQKFIVASTLCRAQTPLDYALTWGFSDVAKIMMRMGCRSHCISNIHSNCVVKITDSMIAITVSDTESIIFNLEDNRWVELYDNAASGIARSYREKISHDGYLSIQRIPLPAAKHLLFFKELQRIGPEKLLSTAARLGNVAAVHALILAGADLDNNESIDEQIGNQDEQNDYVACGRTPLIWAICGQYSPLIVSLLLSAGADPSLASGQDFDYKFPDEGWTPLHHTYERSPSRQAKFCQIVQLLINADAKQKVKEPSSKKYPHELATFDASRMSTNAAMAAVFANNKRFGSFNYKRLFSFSATCQRKFSKANQDNDTMESNWFAKAFSVFGKREAGKPLAISRYDKLDGRLAKAVGGCLVHTLEALPNETIAEYWGDYILIPNAEASSQKLYFVSGKRTNIVVDELSRNESQLADLKRHIKWLKKETDQIHDLRLPITFSQRQQLFVDHKINKADVVENKSLLANLMFLYTRLSEIDPETKECIIPEGSIARKTILAKLQFAIRVCASGLAERVADIIQGMILPNTFEELLYASMLELRKCAQTMGDEYKRLEPKAHKGCEKNVHEVGRQSQVASVAINITAIIKAESNIIGIFSIYNIAKILLDTVKEKCRPYSLTALILKVLQEKLLFLGYLGFKGMPDEQKSSFPAYLMSRAGMNNTQMTTESGIYLYRETEAIDSDVFALVVNTPFESEKINITEQLDLTENVSDEVRAIVDQPWVALERGAYKQGYVRIDVPRAKRECGYKALDISRKKACTLLRKYRDEIEAALRGQVIGDLVGKNSAFRAFVIEQKLCDDTDELTELVNVLTSYFTDQSSNEGTLPVVGNSPLEARWAALLDAYVAFQEHDNVAVDVVVLQVLSRILNFERREEKHKNGCALHIWLLTAGGGGSIQHLALTQPFDESLLSERLRQKPGVRRDIFYNAGHFEKLVFIGYEEELPDLGIAKFRRHKIELSAQQMDFVANEMASYDGNYYPKFEKMISSIIHTGSNSSISDETTKLPIFIRKALKCRDINWSYVEAAIFNILRNNNYFHTVNGRGFNEISFANEKFYARDVDDVIDYIRVKHRLIKAPEGFISACLEHFANEAAPPASAEIDHIASDSVTKDPVTKQPITSYHITEGALAGLSFQFTPQDGHCLFRAVGLYLNKDANALRAEVATYMENNINAFTPFLGTEDELKNRIAMIRNTNEWADHIEIYSLQQLNKRPIIIIRSDADPNLPENLENYLEDENGEPIFVFYNGSTHYDGFTLQPGANARQILANIQQALVQGQTITYQRPPDRSAQFFAPISAATEVASSTLTPNASATCKAELLDKILLTAIALGLPDLTVAAITAGADINCMYRMNKATPSDAEIYEEYFEKLGKCSGKMSKLNAPTGGGGKPKLLPDRFAPRMKADFLDELTPLMQAVVNEELNLVFLLLDQGASINQQNKCGWSALHFVALLSRKAPKIALEMLTLFIERCANPWLQTTPGRYTPFNLALVNTEVFNILWSYTAPLMVQDYSIEQKIVPYHNQHLNISGLDSIAKALGVMGRYYRIVLKQLSDEDINDIEQGAAIIFERRVAKGEKAVNWLLHYRDTERKYKISVIESKAKIKIIKEISGVNSTPDIERIEVKDKSDIKKLEEIATSFDCGASIKKEMAYFLLAAAKDHKNHPVSFWFDEKYYRSYYGEALGELSPLEHFVKKGHREGKNPSILFNTQYYLVNNPSVAASMEANGYTAFEHFVSEGHIAGFDPSPLFNTQYYLSNNPKVAKLVAEGQYTAITHFFELGYKADLNCSQYFNAKHYRAIHAGIDEKVSEHKTTAFAHFITKGIYENLGYAPNYSQEDFLAKHPDMKARVDVEEMSAFLCYMEHEVTTTCQIAQATETTTDAVITESSMSEAVNAFPNDTYLPYLALAMKLSEPGANAATAISFAKKVHHACYVDLPKRYAFKKMRKPGVPIADGKAQGIYFYQEGVADNIYALVVHDKFRAETIDLTPFKEEMPNLAELLHISDDTSNLPGDDVTLPFNELLAKLVLSNCDYPYSIPINVRGQKAAAVFKAIKILVVAIQQLGKNTTQTPSIFAYEDIAFDERRHHQDFKQLISIAAKLLESMPIFPVVHKELYIAILTAIQLISRSAFERGEFGTQKQVMQAHNRSGILLLQLQPENINKAIKSQLQQLRKSADTAPKEVIEAFDKAYDKRIEALIQEKRAQFKQLRKKNLKKDVDKACQEIQIKALAIVATALVAQYLTPALIGSAGGAAAAGGGAGVGTGTAAAGAGAAAGTGAAVTGGSASVASSTLLVQGAFKVVISGFTMTAIPALMHGNFKNFHQDFAKNAATNAAAFAAGELVSTLAQQSAGAGNAVALAGNKATEAAITTSKVAEEGAAAIVEISTDIKMATAAIRNITRTVIQGVFDKKSMGTILAESGIAGVIAAIGEVKGPIHTQLMQTLESERLVDAFEDAFGTALRSVLTSSFNKKGLSISDIFADALMEAMQSLMASAANYAGERIYEALPDFWNKKSTESTEINELADPTNDRQPDNTAQGSQPTVETLPEAEIPTSPSDGDDNYVGEISNSNRAIGELVEQTQETINDINSQNRAEEIKQVKNLQNTIIDILGYLDENPGKLAEISGQSSDDASEKTVLFDYVAILNNFNGVLQTTLQDAKENTNSILDNVVEWWRKKEPDMAHVQKMQMEAQEAGIHFIGLHPSPPYPECNGDIILNLADSLLNLPATFVSARTVLLFSNALKPLKHMGNSIAGSFKLSQNVTGLFSRKFAKITIDESKAAHIFRQTAGHFKKDSEAIRKLLVSVANDKKLYQGTEQFGNKWYAKTFNNGKQVWVQVRDGKIINGGVNTTPRSFNKISGLSNPVIPSQTPRP